MFSLFTKCHKTQADRVLEQLVKKGTVTSLEISQMHPVILNFHEAIHTLRQKHEIETVSELVKGIKHTHYIYKWKLTVPFRWKCKKKYTQEEYDEWVKKGFNAWLNLEAPNAEAYLQTI